MNQSFADKLLEKFDKIEANVVIMIAQINELKAKNVRLKAEKEALEKENEQLKSQISISSLPPLPPILRQHY